MIKGSPCRGLTATARTSASHRLKSFPLYTPLDLHAIIAGESSGGQTESGRFSAAFIHQISDGGPQVTARCSDGVPQGTAGWTNPAKSPQTSGGHPANFNCELNLPDACWMSAGWGLYRRITAGFLQDLRHGSPRDHRAMDFSQLGQQLNITPNMTAFALAPPHPPFSGMTL